MATAADWQELLDELEADADELDRFTERHLARAAAKQQRRLVSDLRLVILNDLPQGKRGATAGRFASRLARAVVASTPQPALLELSGWLALAVERHAGLDDLMEWLRDQGWDCPQDSSCQSTWAHLESIGNQEVEELWWNSLPNWNRAWLHLLEAAVELEAIGEDWYTPETPWNVTGLLPEGQLQRRLQHLAHGYLPAPCTDSAEPDELPPPLHLHTDTHAAHGPPSQRLARRPRLDLCWEGEALPAAA